MPPDQPRPSFRHPHPPVAAGFRSLPQAAVSKPTHPATLCASLDPTPDPTAQGVPLPDRAAVVDAISTYENITNNAAMAGLSRPLVRVLPEGSKDQGHSRGARAVTCADKVVVYPHRCSLPGLVGLAPTVDNDQKPRR